MKLLGDLRDSVFRGLLCQAIPNNKPIEIRSNADLDPWEVEYNGEQLIHVGRAAFESVVAWMQEQGMDVREHFRRAAELN